MTRCLELAKRGAGDVAPNPMVGAVLVRDDRIIGEGWHQQYGGPHAEVNALTHLAIPNGLMSSRGAFSDLTDTTLYVSLEPCAHFGKTPPCTDLIIKSKIPKVVIGCRDPFKEVDGKGIEKLKAAGIVVEAGVLEDECKELNKRFFTFHTQHRPYVILKWAETTDGFVSTAPLPPVRGFRVSETAKNITDFDDSKAPLTEGFGEASLTGGRGARLLITNEFTNRLVHKWRSEEASILVGTNTALHDDPQLTTRLWPGNSPVRLVVDMDLKLPQELHLFNKKARTIVFNRLKHEEGENLFFYQVTEDVSLVHQMMNALYQLNIQSVMVEGGAKLLQSFIDEGMWDEARVIVNSELSIVNGLPAPKLPNPISFSRQNLLKDNVNFYKREGI